MNSMNPIVEISRCPLTNLKRKAKLRKLEWSTVEEKVSIEVLVSYYDENDNIVSGGGITEYLRELPAKNEFLVDAATGLDPDENTVTVVGEYDFFMYMINSGPVHIPTLIAFAITTADTSTRKRLD